MGNDEKARDLGDKRSYRKETEKVNEVSNYREQEVYILNHLDK